MRALRERPFGIVLAVRVTALTLLLAGGSCLTVKPTGDTRQERAPGYAVVYATDRWNEKTSSGSLDIWWQRLPEEAPRLVYSAPGYHSVPHNAGYLPSPDGRWLYIWYEVTNQSGITLATWFLLVGMPDGKVMRIAEVKSHPQDGADRFELTFAPHWLDDHRLLLESTIGNAIFDVRTRKLTKPLPEWPPETLPESPYGYTSLPKPEDFIRQHYPEDLKCAKEATAKFGAELGLGDYLARHDYPEPDTLELMLARPLGIFDFSGYRGIKRAWPCLACSPNHQYVARSGILPTDDAVQWKDLEGNWRVGRRTAIRLDFFDVGEGKQIRDVEDARWGGFAEDGEPHRVTAIPEFTLPRLGDLRFSPDGRFFSYTAYDIQRPHGVPGFRGAAGQVKVRGRGPHGFPNTGVYVRDIGWMVRPREGNDKRSRYEWLYFIPDACNAFVVPAASGR